MLKKKPQPKAPETKAAIQEVAAPDQDVRELLTQGIEMVSAIHHQNDHTREWVRRAQAALDLVPKSDEQSDDESGDKSDDDNEV